MTRLLRRLIPDEALTWKHRCIAWRFDPYNGCVFRFMYAGGLDTGYIEVRP